MTKTYRRGLLPGRGVIRALDGLSLSVGTGSAVGIVGLNGAGKSTLLRILLGYVRPDSGTVAIDGLPPRRYVERKGIAYVPERVAIPPGWTVRGALRAYAMLGNAGDDAWDRVDVAMSRLGLSGIADRRIGTLSKGNVQRVALAQAILCARKLMVLDEPTDGLDPVWIAELRSIVRDWLAADPDRTLLLASHNLPEVEHLVDRVLLLHNGRLAREAQGNGDGWLEAKFLSWMAEVEEARA